MIDGLQHGVPTPCKYLSVRLAPDDILIFHLLCRRMSPDHPHLDDPEFVTYCNGCSPTLQCYVNYTNAKHKAATLSGSRLRKAADLQYSDLYGVPIILVLCEKGKDALADVHASFCRACNWCNKHVCSVSNSMCVHEVVLCTALL